MPIRFKCPHCKKALSVKEHLAGKKAACPVCKKGLKIPVPVPPAVEPPVDFEALAASALADEPPAKAAAPKEQAKPQFIDFPCPFCFEDLHLSAELAGKQTPCPECKKIIKVPVLKINRPKDWREVEKKGPSAALVNQPQHLEGAWGTATDKARVSQAALEEADVFEDDEPPNLGRRIKRVLIVAAVAGIAFLIVSGTMRKRATIRQGDALGQALAYLPKSAEEEPKIKLPPLWMAELHRGAGEYYVQARKALKARDHFVGAGASLRDNVGDPFDADAFRIDLALSLIKLGGSAEEAENKKDPQRLEWKDELLIKELERAVSRIQDPDARWFGLQDVGTQLLERKQGTLAVGLGNLLKGDSTEPTKLPLVTATYTALLVALNKAELAPVPAPDSDKGRKLNPALLKLSRMGYAEGNARLGQLPEALTIAKGGKPTWYSCVAVLPITCSSKNPGEGADFLNEARASLTEVKGARPPWLLLRLIIAAARLESPEKARELIPPQSSVAFKNRVELELLYLQLAKNLAKGEDVPFPEPERFGDTLSRALAWEAVARHKTRLGLRSEVQRLLESEMEDQRLRPFLFLGIALGEQDR